jgi:Ca2+-binding EF-hand superfamily protein
MMKLFAGAAVAALSIAAASGNAQTAPPPGVAQGTAPMPMTAPVPPVHVAPMMRKNVEVRMMSNHAMTRDEVVRHVREMFQRFDINKDGFVTREEIGAFHAKFANMGPMIRKRIEDHGMMMGNPVAMFDRLDTNHDGSISRQEFMAAHSQTSGHRMMVIENEQRGPGMPGMDGDHMQMRMEGMDGEHMKMPDGMEHQKMEFRFGTMEPMHGTEMGMGGFGAHLFEMADANHDGRVSLQEAEGLALQHFDRADRNHDGKITPDEHQEMHVLMREHRPG